MIKQLRMNEDFARPLGPAIPKPAPAAPKAVEIKPGIWQAPDGKLRTDFATGQSVSPAQKAAPVAPLPVLPNALEAGIVYQVTRTGGVGPTYSLWDGKNWECVGDTEQACYMCRCGLSSWQDWRVVE
jgi:hypothetical protein